MDLLAPNPKSSRSRRDTKPQNLANVVEWAIEHCPDYYQTLSFQTDLVFEPRDTSRRLEDPRRDRFHRLPERTTSHILRVGQYDKSPELTERAVPAFTCIGFETYSIQGTEYFLYKTEAGNYIDITGSTRDIYWESPFGLMCDGNSPSAWYRIKALISFYFLAAGYLDEIKDDRSFYGQFKLACAWIGNDGEKPRANPKKPLPPVEPRYGREAPPHTPKDEPKEHKAAMDLQDSSDVRPMADNASNTASDPANPKRGLREFENAYDLLEASHKRVKIENGELSFANEKLKTIKMQLEEEKTQLKQGLDEKEKRVQALEKELATKEDARAAEEKTAIEAVARAEQAEQKAEAQANAERAITNEALAAKARVELELRALRSARGP